MIIIIDISLLKDDVERKIITNLLYIIYIIKKDILSSYSLSIIY